MVALAALVTQRLLPRSQQRPVGTKVLGVGLLAAGVATSALAARGFQREGTTLDPAHPEESTVLVTTGMHGLSRNPMYLGLMGVVLGHAVWRRSPWALVPAAAAWLWLDRVQIPAEERALADRYGDDYRSYRGRVPRWLGPTAPATD